MSMMKKKIYDYVVLTDNFFLPPRIDLWESPIDNPDFILFTYGSYLQGLHEKYQAGYAVVFPV